MLCMDGLISYFETIFKISFNIRSSLFIVFVLAGWQLIGDLQSWPAAARPKRLSLQLLIKVPPVSACWWKWGGLQVKTRKLELLVLGKLSVIQLSIPLAT